MSDSATKTPLTISITPLKPELDSDAATILADATGEGTPARGQQILQGARSDPDATVYGLTVAGELVAVYVLRTVKLMNEISVLSVAAGHRRQGHGRACLYDALLRSGRRPLVVETDDDTVGFYRACGFKLVGKRKGPDGQMRYRLGWHAPIPRPAGDTDGGNCG